MSDRAWGLLAVWGPLIATAWVGDRFVRGILLVADEPRPVVARGGLAEFEAVSTDVFSRARPTTTSPCLRSATLSV